MTLFSAHWHTLLDALKRLAREPLANLLTIFVIGVTLSLPAGLWSITQNLGRLTENASPEPQISLFLSKSSGHAAINALAEKLRQTPGVSKFVFVPKEQALKELTQNAGIGDLAGTLEQNPLPDAFIVYPSESAPDFLENLRSVLQQLPGVATAQLDSAWAQRLHGVIVFARRAALLLAFLLAAGLIAVIGNTIRLDVLTLRQEIEVSQLIGATNAFIRRPFLYAGLIQGLLGGAVAWLLIGACLLSLNAFSADMARLYGVSLQLGFLSLPASLVLLGLSASTGWLAAYLAVNHHLRDAQPYPTGARNPGA
mgnify:CR=1 FL=1